MTLTTPVLGQQTIAAREQLCKAARKNSTWIWNTLRETKTHDCSMYEESLTDFFVLKLKQQVRHGFCIKTFTRNMEGSTTGSDWEWWFGGTDGTWLGMRVQAKKIYLPAHRYNELYKKPDKSGKRQVVKLVQDAKNNGLVPIYCLYTYWDNALQKVLSRAHGRRVQYRTPYGAAVLPASHVKNGISSNKLTDLFPYMRPLSWLFCVGTQSSSSFPRAIWANVGELNLVGAEERQNIEQFVRQQAPSYVYELLEMRSNAQSQSLDDLNLGRVTIIQEIAPSEP